MAEGIASEEQLQRAIAAEQWYWSEGESEEEEEQTPSQKESESSVDQWRIGVYEDDDNLLTAAVEKLDLEALVKYLTEPATGTSEDITDAPGNLPQSETGVNSAAAGKNGDGKPGTTTRKEAVASPPSAQPVKEDECAHVERPKCYYIAHEMMTSERTYVQSLRLIEKVFHGAVKTALLTGRTILPEGGQKEVFLNIGEIYALNFDLLQELEDRIESWDSSPVIADVIAKRAPFFKLYSMYTSRFDDSQLAYCKWLKTCKPFANLVKTIESSRLCKGLPLSSYMLCPIQRIPRYRLLLEDYLQHLPEEHPDFENTRAAIEAISAAAVHMNNRIKDLENQAQCVKIQRAFLGGENIVAPGRKYLGRGLLFFIPGTKDSKRKKKQRVLFLFTDILLITSASGHGKYRVKHQITIRNLMVSLVQSPKLENAFCVAEKGSTKPLRFTARTAEERHKWMREFHKAILEERDRRSSFIASSRYSTFLNDTETNSSILAVLNDPSFEHRQPSWVRRSLRITHRVAPPTIVPATDAAGVRGRRRREGDQVDWGFRGTREVDMETEFVSEREEEQHGAGTPALLQPGVDNTLSSYLNQRSVEGGEWQRRWYVLTNRALICYETHSCDVALGALSLTSYSIATPDKDDGIERPNVIRLSHPGKPPYFFQLPSSYDFARWHSTLKELLCSDVNRITE